jgi:hypothetical protein
VQAEAVQPEAVQAEAVQPEAVQAEAVQPEAVQAEAVQAEATPSDLDVSDRPSGETAAAVPEQVDVPAASVIEADQPVTDSEPPTDGELPVAPHGADDNMDTDASDVVEPPDAPIDAEGAPNAGLVEPLENAVPIEPVAETLGQGEES